MPVDNSIYFQQQSPDVIGSIEKGLKMSDMIRQNQIARQEQQKQAAIKEAYNQASIQNADGSIGIDNTKLMNNLSNLVRNPEINYSGMDLNNDKSKLAEQQAKQEEAQRKALADRAGVITQVFDPNYVNSKESWINAKQKALSMGYKEAAELPDDYSPEIQNKLLDHAKLVAVGVQNYAEDKRKQESNDNSVQDRALKRQELAQQKNYALDSSESEKLKNDLTKGWVGRSGQAGVVQNKINSAEAALALVEQGKNQQNGLDSRQIEELALSTGRLLGATAMAQVQSLVPHTLFGKTQTIAEYLSSDPKGAGQQAFVDRLEETIKRELELAADQKKQFQIEQLSGHQNFKKRNPDLYNSIISSANIDPSMIDEKGRYKKPSPSAPPPPKVGDVLNGHVYLGGDPKDKKSWKEQ